MKVSDQLRRVFVATSLIILISCICAVGCGVVSESDAVDYEYTQTVKIEIPTQLLGEEGLHFGTAVLIDPETDLQYIVAYPTYRSYPEQITIIPRYDSDNYQGNHYIYGR